MKKTILCGMVTLALAGAVRAEDTAAGNMVFFRAGRAWLDRARGPGSITTNLGDGASTEDDGSLLGAGLDLLMSRDVYGRAPHTWLVGELSLEHKNFGPAPSGPLITGQRPATRYSQLTIGIGPKLKFNAGKSLRPWLMPAALDFHVISPPSSGVTVLDVGLQSAAGLEYAITPEIKLGVDGRYHWADGQTDTDNDFGSAAAYVGLCF